MSCQSQRCIHVLNLFRELLAELLSADGSEYELCMRTVRGSYVNIHNPLHDSLCPKIRRTSYESSTTNAPDHV